MSKLFWLQGYRQLKLITTLNQDTKSTGCLLLSPGQGHEINFGDDMVKMLPENGVLVGNRGFYSRKLFENLCAMMLFLSSVLSPTGNGMKTIALRRGSSFLGSIEQKVNGFSWLYGVKCIRNYFNRGTEHEF